MIITQSYNGRIFTRVSFFESEALSREYLLAGCVAQEHEHQLQDDEFGGVVIVFGTDVRVADLISSGLQYVRENRQ